MKCPYCQNLAADCDRVCYSCKRYIGNERATEKIGGDTNYEKLLPVLFVCIGMPILYFYVFQPSRNTANDYLGFDIYRMFITGLCSAGLAFVGNVIGRLLGDGTTVRV